MTAEQPSDGYLFDLYRRYIGEPEDRTDVYLGFGLFLGGIGFAIAALALFVVSSTAETGSGAYVTWAEPAYAFAMVALPAAMLGIVVLLPSERRVLYTSIVGAAVCLVAVGAFLYAYPDDWHGFGNDYTAEVIAVYAVGLAGISASTGAALIAHYLDMAQTVKEVVRETETDDDEEDELSDEEIRQDIDDAMDGVELSWGGVEKSDNKRLSFSSDDFDDVQVSAAVGTTTVRSSGVDEQVSGLKGLKGGDTKTTTSQSTVDEQTQKLKELREQQREESSTTATADTQQSGSGSESGSVFAGIRNFLNTLFKRN